MLKKLMLPALLLAFAHTASADPLTLSFGGGGWIPGSVIPGAGCVDIDNSQDPGVGGTRDSVRWGAGENVNDARIGTVHPDHADYIVGGDACWDATNTGGDFSTEAGYLTGEVSGYNFDPLADQSVTGGFVNLGTFQHVNHTILGGTGINAIDYTFTLAHNGAEAPLTFILQFLHNETIDTGAGCCADLVTMSTPALSALLTVGSSQYLFELLGFGATAGEALSNFVFNSPEGDTNHTYLWGNVTQVPAVPEPATLTMLGTGLLGLGAAARRRMRKSRS